MPKKGVFFIAALGAALCAVGAASAQKQDTVIQGAGSTFVAPLVTKWQTAAQQQLGLTLSYNPVGSGGGVSAITNK